MTSTRTYHTAEQTADTKTFKIGAYIFAIVPFNSTPRVFPSKEKERAKERLIARKK